MRLVVNVVIVMTVVANRTGEIDLIMKPMDVCRVQKDITVRSSPKEGTCQMITDYRVRQGPIVPRDRHHGQSHVQPDFIVQRLHSMKSSHAMQEITVLKEVQT